MKPATNPTAAGASASLPATTEPAAAAPLPAARRVRQRPGVLQRLAASRVLAGLFLLGVVACTAVIVLDGAAARSPLIPKQPPIAGWLDGIGSKLDYRTFLIALLIMSACYAGVVWCSRVISTRLAIGTIVLLHLMSFLGPILLSQDIFQYIAYGRLGAVHGLNPYTTGPAVIPHDPVFRYLGSIWYHTPAAYGPLFTLLSYPLALLGLEGAIWGMKLLMVAASLATLALVWACARRLGRNAVVAVLIVGLNPLTIVYGLGGFHNDLLANALMMAGVLLVLRDRDGLGAASVITAGAVKATSVAVLPFMLLARRRASVIYGALAGMAAMALLAYLAFGAHGLDFVSVINRNAKFVSTDSFPNEVAHLLGYPGVFPVDRTLYRLASVVALAWLMWRTWRGYDWIAASAWALLIIAVTTTWLLPWYLLWALPLAVLTRDRRVLWAVMIVSAMFIAHQTAPLFSPTQ